MLDPIQLGVASLTGDQYDIGLIRAHCHVDEQPGTLQDALLLLYMQSAISWAEGEMHRTIFSRSHQWVLRHFPFEWLPVIRLPRGKTQSVESIQYWNNATLMTLTGPDASPPGTDFQQSIIGDDGGELLPPITGAWPNSDLNVPAPVTINFTAGWSASQVPADITQALMFYVSDCMEMRGTADVEKGSYADIRANKISAYTLNRIYGPPEIWPPAGPRW
jgi:hypothetical protein